MQFLGNESKRLQALCRELLQCVSNCKRHQQRHLQSWTIDPKSVEKQVL
jgi:hypothetical protein